MKKLVPLERPTISFAVTCMNRLHQLEQVMEANLKDCPGAEFVLLDYNSRDGLESWVRDNLCDYLEAGRLVYVRERRAETWSGHKAKNIAHRFCSGKILCNLDGDNYASGLPEALEALRPGHFIQANNKDLDGPDLTGTFGRIAFGRADFYALGGYEESLPSMGYEDTDLINRAKELGLREQVLADTVWPVAIPNSPADRIRHTAEGRGVEWESMAQIAMTSSQNRVKMFGPVANLNRGWGRVYASVNFGPPTLYPEIRP